MARYRNFDGDAPRVRRRRTRRHDHSQYFRGRDFAKNPQTATSTTVGEGGHSFGYGVVNLFKALSGTLRTATNGSVTGQIVDSSICRSPAQTVTVGGSSVPPTAADSFDFPRSRGKLFRQRYGSWLCNAESDGHRRSGADTTLTVIMARATASHRLP